MKAIFIFIMQIRLPPITPLIHLIILCHIISCGDAVSYDVIS